MIYKQLKTIGNEKICKIFIGDNILQKAVEDCGLQNKKVLIVADSNVAPLHYKTLAQVFKGDLTFSFSFAAGESAKNFETLRVLLSRLSELEFDRSDYIIALGGGVTGDLAGFAASIYQRGIGFIQMPTTLLAAVDSSIGGKNGINLSGTKNCIGTISQPSAVICDYGFLHTLPEAELKNGLYEMIKYGIIKSKKLFEKISDIDYAKPKSIFDCISECVEIKISIVEADEQDKNERRLLNFGHTVGHAVEALSDYRVPHGTAVAIGSVAAAKISHRLGLCDVNIVEQIENIFEKAGVDTRLVYDKQQVIHAIMHDKKRQGDKITLALCEKIGYGVLRDIEISKLSDLTEGL